MNRHNLNHMHSLKTLHNAHITTRQPFQMTSLTPKPEQTAFLAAASDEAHNDRQLAQCRCH